LKPPILNIRKKKKVMPLRKKLRSAIRACGAHQIKFPFPQVPEAGGKKKKKADSTQ